MDSPWRPRRGKSLETPGPQVDPDDARPSLFVFGDEDEDGAVASASSDEDDDDDDDDDDEPFVVVGTPKKRKKRKRKAPQEEARSEALERIARFDLRPREVREHLDRYVVRQDDAKKVLSVAICDHYNVVRRCLADDSEKAAEYSKPNILVLGPSGSGKTYATPSGLRDLEEDGPRRRRGRDVA